MYKVLTEQQVKEILDKHWLWKMGKEGGEPACFSNCVLKNLNLRERNFSFVNFQNALIQDVNFADCAFHYSDFSSSSLTQVNMDHTVFANCKLNHSVINYATFRGARFKQTNFLQTAFLSSVFDRAHIKHSQLTNTGFDGCSFYAADFAGSAISGASFPRANLCAADLSGAQISSFVADETTAFLELQCPETGSFIGYKSAEGYIVKLFIPASAQRSSATTRKCRCSKAKVLGIYFLDGTKSEEKTVHSDFNVNFTYTVGETVEVSNFDTNRWRECSTGIHFFLTFDEARRYC